MSQTTESKNSTAPRFDIIAVNWYPKNNHSTTYHTKGWAEIVKTTFHDTTGRPIYISEFGLAAEDADTYDTLPYLTVARWRKKTVEYQYQRGWAYQNFISTWANLPFIVGANWYKWANGYASKSKIDARNSGIVDDTDTYYAHLSDNIRSINAQLNTISRSGNFTLDDINWESVSLNICD